MKTFYGQLSAKRLVYKNEIQVTFSLIFSSPRKRAPNLPDQAVYHLRMMIVKFSKQVFIDVNLVTTDGEKRE